MNRKKWLIQLRPEIQHQSTEDPLHGIESFQNHIIRPILKFQNEWITSLFQEQLLTKYKIELTALDSYTLRDKIFQTLKSDHQLRDTLIGGVLGLMSTEELQYFLIHAGELRRRTLAMIKERLWDQLTNKER